MNLPLEIIEHILYLSGLETAIKASSLLSDNYIIRKLISEYSHRYKEEALEEIMKECSGASLEYLYHNSFLDEYFQHLHLALYSVPYYNTVYFNFAIQNRDLKKLEMIDLIFPKSCLDIRERDYAQKEGMKDILEWIEINRPCECLGILSRYPRCNKEVKKNCNCKRCGNGKGYLK